MALILTMNRDFKKKDFTKFASGNTSAKERSQHLDIDKLIDHSHNALSLLWSLRCELSAVPPCVSSAIVDINIITVSSETVSHIKWFYLIIASLSSYYNKNNTLCFKSLQRIDFQCSQKWLSKVIAMLVFFIQSLWNVSALNT